ncbi:SGNH/GDSL hydrolase family protein [Paucibacter sp. APW11]|uniref:SGNH/GDSL hydrolase family protein n=1 Tax=Roseateles aquae TaxID=3077235 RepID=A0ABU3PAM7_9BURK|nr:SGNH/GDSL hydrolase family protein [Paucibacter sp. APW11]MDT8999642.1 SGNH/GDSL hydrolase family protein [Paucibacter sp. APW11]
MKSFKQGVRRLGCALLCVAALGVVAGCGGGTQQIDPFVATRLITFGDEFSLLTPEGKKLSINEVDPSSGALLCRSNPTWVQALAAMYGLIYAECNPDNYAAPQAKMYAASGAKVADVQKQLDQFFSVSTVDSKTLVTMLAGANDVLDLYRQFPTQSQASLLVAAEAAGQLMADQVNRIANAGGRVIVVTVPDMGLTPFALKERLAKGDIDRAAFLTALTAAFNTKLRLSVVQDGHFVGLVLGDEAVQSIVKFPGAYGFANVTEPACLSSVALKDCTSKTLLSEASPTTWLWSSDTMLSYGGQSRIGLLAQTRARGNPF